MTKRAKDAAPKKNPKTGTWGFVLDLPACPGGIVHRHGEEPCERPHRMQVRRKGFATLGEAKEVLNQLKYERSENTYVPPRRDKLGEWLAGEWLPAIVHTIDRDTWRSYERNMRLHVVPVLGGFPLQDITPPMLNRLYADLLLSGRKDGRPGGLSARSVLYVHSILHRAFRDAVKWGSLRRNPADAAAPPSADEAKAPEMKVWTKHELRRFLQLMDGDRYRWPFLFLATTGCRRGEALGLRWSDVNLDDGLVSIRRTLTESGFKERTKTKKSRVIELDATTLAALRTWKAEQAKERLLLGERYRDHGLVFCLDDGRPYNVERFSREFARRLERAPFSDELTRIRLHDLRHTWATLALIAGVDVKVVSERLGHASPMVTWSVYQHVVRGMQTDAAEKVASLIFGEAL